MDRRQRIARRSFKEEPVYDEEELVEGEDEENPDEDYDVDSLLNMRPGDYGCGRRRCLRLCLLHSSSTGWMPVPQHQLPPQPLSVCRVENCMADMSKCEAVSQDAQGLPVAQIAVAAGLHQRFCQQGSRFHLVSEFDEPKRSC